jgi:hypothetical protein
VRRISALAIALACLLGLALPAAGAGTVTVTSQEWNWMTSWGPALEAGDLAGAMDTWAKLVQSTRSHNDDACGNYARMLGRELDKQGRYAEALAYYDIEFECYGRLDSPESKEGMLWDQRRAEQIRPEIRAFVVRPAAAAPPGKLAKFEPAAGTFLGGAMDKDPAILGNMQKVSGVYGKPYALALVYAEWGSYAKNVATTSIWKESSALQVAWQPKDGLSVVRDDNYLRTFARQLKEYARPVFLRFGGEMNGRWVEWHETPALYREKFALVARIMREEAPNVAMVWSPNYVGDDYPMDDYYPGDQWVDWVGINGYQEAYFQGDPNSSIMYADNFYQGKRTNPLDKLKAIYAAYSPRKPIMIGETGFGWAAARGTRDETTWAVSALQRYYGYLPLLFPRIKAVSYFNVDLPSNTSRYLLSASPRMTEAFKTATANDWYLSDVRATSPAFWRPMEQATLLGQTQVAAYVNLGDRGLSRVEYLVDSVVRATARQIPWAASLDLSGLEAGPHSITVKAYDGQGSLGHQRTYAFDTGVIKVNLNGRYIDFDQPPLMLDDRVLVPARAILEALGAQIAWDGGTETVTATRDGSVLKLQIGNAVPTLDGRPLKALDVPAQLIGGRTLVPARFVSENYHMKVDWDYATQTVTITPKP